MSIKKYKIGVELVGYTCYYMGMPGQRATDKKQFTAAFKKEELAAIDAAAARLGLTRTEFLRRAAMRQVKLEQEEQQQKGN